MINAPHDKEFVFHDGMKAKNLLELVEALEKSTDTDFSEFASVHKNDFSNWIEYVLLDKELADKIRPITSRNATIQILKDKINEIAVEDSIMKMSKREYENEKNRENTKKIVLSELTNTEKKQEHSKEIKERKRWFRILSKKQSERKLAKMEMAEEQKYKPEREMHRELGEDYKENIFWMILYVILILLIVALLAYKLLI